MLKTIGDRIKKIRNDLNLTQQELAYRLGVKTKGTVNSWEKDRNLPNLQNLKDLSKLGRRTIDWIVTGIENERSYIMEQLREREKELNELREINMELQGQAKELLKVAEKGINYKRMSKSMGD